MSFQFKAITKKSRFLRILRVWDWESLVQEFSEKNWEWDKSFPWESRFRERDESLAEVCWKDVSIKNSSWKSMLLHNVYHFSGAFTNAICFRPRIVSYLMYSPRPWGGLFSHTCQIDVLWQTAPFVFLSPSLFAIGFVDPDKKGFLRNNQVGR